MAIFSASLLLPKESMNIFQWFGAIAIILAAIFEVFSAEKAAKIPKNFS